MAGLKLVLVLLVCAAVAAPLTVDAITCGTVVASLSNCVSYLQKGGVPPPACCSGVKGLNSAAKTTADRQAICTCLKKSAGSFSTTYAASLPSKCGVNIPYKISPSTDCTKIT